MKLLYKPLGIVFGVLAGLLGRRLFQGLWGLIDEQDPPTATTKPSTWKKVLAAAALEGLTFKVARAAVDRAGASGFERVTGVWPGEQPAQPE
ncbi:MAG TPA: DUF4235 domain-containing protein [Solirubrobacteraceae bacterium]|nr:DUF4235 domain-containing protein [Solirubrobacteraceae bacterium]